MQSQVTKTANVETLNKLRCEVGVVQCTPVTKSAVSSH